ncbi:MAG: 3'-5' exonuclease [Thermodesulfovibrionales bacterium]
MNAITFCREKLSCMMPKRHFSIEADTPVTEAGYVVLDTELTGMDPLKDSIVSVGAVRMKGGRIDLGSAFYRVVKPSTEMKAESIVVHEIMPSEVDGKPSIDNILIELSGFCRDDVIVGHFVKLDMDFINKDMRRVYETNMKNRVVDTRAVHEWMQEHDCEIKRVYGGAAEDLNLFALAKRYRIPVSGAHNALSDAFMTAQLFQRFLAYLPKCGVRTLGDLLRIGKP